MYSLKTYESAWIRSRGDRGAYIGSIIAVSICKFCDVGSVRTDHNWVGVLNVVFANNTRDDEGC